MSVNCVNYYQYPYQYPQAWYWDARSQQPVRYYGVRAYMANGCVYYTYGPPPTVPYPVYRMPTTALTYQPGYNCAPSEMVCDQLVQTLPVSSESHTPTTTPTSESTPTQTPPPPSSPIVEVTPQNAPTPPLVSEGTLRRDPAWRGVLPNPSFDGYLSPIIFVGSTSTVVKQFVAALSKMNIHNKGISGDHANYFYLNVGHAGLIKRLLGHCDLVDGRYYFVFEKISCEVIPWCTKNLFYRHPGFNHDGDLKTTIRSVFVGSLHGRLTASDVARIFGDVFGCVKRVSLCSDENDYPTGSGVVTFADERCCRRAVHVGYVFINTPLFRRKVMIDPFIQVNSTCGYCPSTSPTGFCRDCFHYFCDGCADAHGKHKVFEASGILHAERRGRRISRFESQ